MNVGTVLWLDNCILMVNQHCGDGDEPGWTLPGGVVDPIVAFLRGETGYGAYWVFAQNEAGEDYIVSRTETPGAGQPSPKWKR